MSLRHGFNHSAKSRIQFATYQYPETARSLFIFLSVGDGTCNY